MGRAAGVSPALLLLVALLGAGIGGTRAEDEELVDSPKPSALAGPCEAGACAAHCKQQKHAGGRCDEETCVCQDFKNKGRCAVLGFGCGCATCMQGAPPPPPPAPKPCVTCGIGGLPMFNANNFVINKGQK